ncbi:alpha/beta hydrolase [Variovorax terrae]|uniref:Alpha/beta hydrolase n=1 Tax=Variovorax terrae TaxID=2923278 RepID=A0A9X1VW61_9BURK|nr:alpha/beta hydrolase [Variovorax terrae]MCJ0764911.1 alpha/beta hydrolase [Variovorax terrae]
MAALMAASCATVQMPPDAAEKIRAMGRVVDGPATAAIFAPRVREREPFANVKIERDARYGPAERNLLDVFQPTEAAAAPRPVLIFVHGGGFVAGARRNPGSPFYDNVMLWAVRNGMVGVTMTYRIAPQNTWPAGGEDVGLAVKWVHDNIATHGGDAKRVFILGHSAGAAHIADYLAKPRFQRVPGSGLAGAMVLSGAYQVAPPLVVPAYHGSDASQYTEQSSLPGLLASSVPLFVGSAEFDPPAFAEQSTALVDALCKASRCPASAVFADHNHMAQPYSLHTDDRVVSEALLKFIRDELKAQP